MLELGIGADILRGVGWIVRLLFLAAIAYALWNGKNWKRRLLNVALVVLVFSTPLWPGIGDRIRYERKYKAAKALFDERCKTAGERINKTVESVDGIVWERWRPKELNYGDQFARTDPYGRDCGGEDCIKAMLRVTSGSDLNVDEAKRQADGYSFVETIDPTWGISYRYTGVVASTNRRTGTQTGLKDAEKEADTGVFRFAVERESIQKFTARYSVTWRDVSTEEDRKHWIAGGSIRIVDLQTNELVAERIGYLMDPGQGGTGGQRSPWTWARSSTKGCPSIAEHNFVFIRKVLQPSKGE
ncbi:hypothetical protein [Variovorax sp. JS1663]|uniref:hypothetical protein n=1 Tax=Variovorax sp. JS1663 TaxID=1851577 RepID=UPI00117D3948|nr:hypothetical protein [Variovorax sp. JS1663]